MLRSALSSRTLKAAAVVGAGAVSTQREKLSIYPEPEPQLVLIDTPSALENQIGEVRTHLTHAYSDGYARVQGIVSRWIGIEEAVEAQIKALHAPDEPLTPGVLYVAVGTLAGSIIASSRGLPTRLVLPSIFFLASAQHFLPKTSHNVGEYLGSLEDTYAPRLAQTHETAKAHTAMTVARAGEALKGAREAFGEGVGHALRVAEDRTGVKIAQAVRWGERTEAAVERKVAEVKADAGKEVQAGEAKLRARAEEIVRGVREAAERAEKEVVRVVKQAGADVAAAAPSVDAAAAVDAVERKEEDMKESAKRGLDETKGEAKRVVEETVKASTPVEDKPAPRKRLV